MIELAGCSEDMDTVRMGSRGNRRSTWPRAQPNKRCPNSGRCYSPRESRSRQLRIKHHRDAAQHRQQAVAVCRSTVETLEQQLRQTIKAERKSGAAQKALIVFSHGHL